MPTTYEECDKSVYRRLEAIVSEHRPDLAACHARITLLLAFCDKGKPAMRSRGHRVAGKCKINGIADRAEGKGDATITLDGDRWPVWSERKRDALLHHELSHIAPWGQKYHADDRPVLKARYADWDFDGFDEVARLYGADSFEAANLAEVAERHRQLVLPFLDPDGEVVRGIEQSLGRRLDDREKEAIGIGASKPADDWRSVPLRNLGIEAGLPGKLAARNVSTVGDMEAFIRAARDPAELFADREEADAVSFALARFATERGGEALSLLKLMGLEPGSEEGPAAERAAKILRRTKEELSASRPKRGRKRATQGEAPAARARR